ncbi:MAG: hypothetical protein U1E22_02895, partial [Coriobacteriia bacterium]|nr:hypothetical protein [Coriobacteriia bacterium]
ACETPCRSRRPDPAPRLLFRGVVLDGERIVGDGSAMVLSGCSGKQAVRAVFFPRHYAPRGCDVACPARPPL